MRRRDITADGSSLSRQDKEHFNPVLHEPKKGSFPYDVTSRETNLCDFPVGIIDPRHVTTEKIQAMNINYNSTEGQAFPYLTGHSLQLIKNFTEYFQRTKVRKASVVITTL